MMQMYESRTDCDLGCFDEVLTGDSFLLVGREPRPDFALADLCGRRVATVSEVRTPLLCPQEDLRRAGRDPNALHGLAIGQGPAMRRSCAAASSRTPGAIWGSRR